MSDEKQANVRDPQLFKKRRSQSIDESFPRQTSMATRTQHSRPKNVRETPRTGGTSRYSGRAGVTDLTGVTWGLAGTPSLNLSPRFTSRHRVTLIKDVRKAEEEEMLARLSPFLCLGGKSFWT